MAKVAYGIAGEGLGHTMRAMSIVPRLLELGHEVIFLIGDSSEGILRKEFSSNNKVKFIKIPVPLFHYNKNKSLNIIKTLFNFIIKWPERYEASSFLKRMLKNVDLFISDYEPISSWTAKKMGKPLILLSSQEIYRHGPRFAAPINFLLYHFFIKLTCHWFSPNPDLVIISHFFNFKLKNKVKDKVYLVNSFIRKELDKEERFENDFILVYIHPSVEDLVLDNLIKSNKKAIVYGLGSRPKKGKVFFEDIDSGNFIRRLLTCSKVICTAGTTLIGECIYLNIPMLLVPIPKQKEQEYNALLSKRYYKIPVLKQKDSKLIKDFVKNKSFCEYSVNEVKNGADEAVIIINNFIKKIGG